MKAVFFEGRLFGVIKTFRLTEPGMFMQEQPSLAKSRTGNTLAVIWRAFPALPANVHKR